MILLYLNHQKHSILSLDWRQPQFWVLALQKNDSNYKMWTWYLKWEVICELVWGRGTRMTLILGKGGFQSNTDCRVVGLRKRPFVWSLWHSLSIFKMGVIQIYLIVYWWGITRKIELSGPQGTLKKDSIYCSSVLNNTGNSSKNKDSFCASNCWALALNFSCPIVCFPLSPSY